MMYNIGYLRLWRCILWWKNLANNVSINYGTVCGSSLDQVFNEMLKLAHFI